MADTGHPSFTDNTQSNYVPRTLNKADGTVVGNVTPFQAFDTGVTPTDRSGTVAASTSTQVMPANALRRGFDFFASGADFWLNKVGNAAGSTGGSIFVPQGTLYESPISGSSMSIINCWSSTASAAYTASEW